MKKFLDNKDFCVRESEDNPNELIICVDMEDAEEIEIPADIENKKVTRLVIRSYSFQENYTPKLKKLSLPATIKSIFLDTIVSLPINDSFSVFIDPENPWLVSDEKAVFTKDMSEILMFTARGDQVYELPKGVRLIHEKTFMGTENLKEIILHEGLEEIGDYAFWSSGIEKATLPDSVKIIGEYAFYFSYISDIRLSKNLEIIKDNAFCALNQINELHFHSALREVGENNQPKKVCTYKADEDNKLFAVCDGILYTKDMQTVIKASQNIAEKVIIPDGVTKIGEDAFSRIGSLKEVQLSPSVRTIENGAFRYCDNLEKINLENVMSIGDSAFDGTKLK